MTRRASLALCLLGALGTLACCLLVAGSRGIKGDDGFGLLWVVLVWSALAVALAAVAARALSPRTTVGAGLLLAAGLQAAAMTGGPQLSDDLYRYVWDARVAASGTDPFAYRPGADELVGLRTPDLWPTGAECLSRPGQRDRWEPDSPFLGLNKVCTPINRPESRTIYPPAAQLAFRAAYATTDGLPVELRVELPMALASLALTGLLMRVLVRAGRHPAIALAYGLSPLAVVESGMDGHVDVLAALVGVLCLLTATTSRLRPRAAAAAVGALFAVAVLIKLYPALLALPLVARWGLRSSQTWLAAGTALAVSAVLYAPHVAAVGLDVVGFLPGYLKENDYGGGGRFLVLDLVLPQAVTTAAAVLAVLAISVWSLRQRPVGRDAVLVHATTTLGLLLLVVTPGAAWYFALLTCLALLAGRPEWQAMAAAAYTAYFVALQGGEPVLAQLAYAAAGAVALMASARRRGAVQAHVASVTRS